MPQPPLISYGTEAEYRAHFERVYCQGIVTCFDGIPVHFRKRDFNHCFFESSKRDRIKDTFSNVRAERIDWIKATLENPNADLYQGWDAGKKAPDPDRRAAVVFEDFVVVISLKRLPDGAFRGSFVTAFKAENSIGKIRAMPRWVKK